MMTFRRSSPLIEVLFPASCSLEERQRRVKRLLEITKVLELYLEISKTAKQQFGSYFKALKILQEHKEKTGYYQPHSGTIRRHISQFTHSPGLASCRCRIELRT